MFSELRQQLQCLKAKKNPLLVNKPIQYGCITDLFLHFVFATLLLFSVSSLQAATTLEQVSIQLKWKHAFQFAGYYAAIEKGFYRDNGLEVTLKEIDFSKDNVAQVVDGESEYGVADSALALRRFNGDPVVLVDQIFQHSPLAFASHRKSGIISPYEMSGKKVAYDLDSKGNASLSAMLLDALGNLSHIERVPFDRPFEHYLQQFIEGKIDAISIYTTAQPYRLKELGIEVNIINPQSYGIDFYGDNLFTTQKEIEEHPERVKKISQATLKGWQYALDHPDEIIQLIRQKYALELSEQSLQYEARTTRKMILPELIKLGSYSLKRFRQTTEIYKRFGFIKENQSLDNNFFYQQVAEDSIHVDLTEQEKTWLKAHPQIIVGGEKDWPPFDFVDTNGKYTGIANDYLNLVASKTGLNFKVKIDQWSHHLQNIQDNKIDLLGAAYYTKQRSEYVNYSTPYIDGLDYFFVRDDLNISSFEDLNGLRVAIPKDYAQGGILKKHFPQIKIITVASHSDAIDKVLGNGADMLFDNYATLTYALKREGINTIVPFKSTRQFGKTPIHIISRKGAPELTSIVQKGLNAISIEEKQKIYNRWFGNNNEIENPSLNLTAEERQWLNNHSVIRFTGDPNWLPYEAFDKKGNYIGIVADHLKIIEQKLGIKVDIIPSKTWAESVTKVKEGKIDVLSETSDSDLKSHLSFTQPYASSPVIIVMKNDEDYVENIAQIKNKKIAVIKEYGYVPKIIAKHPNIDFKIVDTLQEGLTAVSTGKIDALLATLAQASYHISELGINNIRIVGKTEFNTKLAFGMRKEFAPLVPLFNRALTSIDQGDKQQILRKWGKHAYAEKVDYELLATIATIFFTILAIIFYWNRKLAKEIEFRKEAETQTQVLIDNIPLQIIVTSYEGTVLTANPKALADYKINKNEVSQFNISEFYYDKNDREAVINELTDKGKVDRKILRFKQLDGSVRSMMVSIMPIMFHHEKSLLTIAVDMTERLEIEAALQDAKDNAEQATRAKSEFLSNMSHEIRTPMNAIIGFTELLGEQVKEPRLQSFVQTIQSAGNNLLALINDVLDLSKIEAGKLTIEKTACNPHGFFTEIGNIFALKMREKNLDFILDIDPVIPQSLQIDATRLRQVLFNLIGNAVKFTDQGFIRITARTDNEDKIRSKLDLIVDIEDTGIGIAEDQQNRVFNQFEQSSGQDNKKYGGTGLGLSISHRLVELMGGEISLRSKMGLGSTFTIKLLNVNVASLHVDTKIDGEKTEQGSNNKKIEFQPSHVLIVDDIADNRDLLLANFENTELTIMQAENGLEAVNLVKQQLAKEHPFDLVLMDIRMPVMDGYQATEEIMAICDVPVIALTASVMAEEFERVKNNNFKGYLRKPVFKADLFAELCKFLPFEKIVTSESEPQKIALTAAELIVLPSILEKLERQVVQCKIILKSNNITEIKIFADEVMDIAKLYPVSIIFDYAEQLLMSIDSFDIAGIKSSLNDYPQLINQLEELK